MNFLLAPLSRARAFSSILKMTMNSIALCYLRLCYRCTTQDHQTGRGHLEKSKIICPVDDCESI